MLKLVSSSKVLSFNIKKTSSEIRLSWNYWLFKKAFDKKLKLLLHKQCCSWLKLVLEFKLNFEAVLSSDKLNSEIKNQHFKLQIIFQNHFRSKHFLKQERQQCLPKSRNAKKKKRCKLVKIEILQKKNLGDDRLQTDMQEQLAFFVYTRLPFGIFECR